MKTKPNLPTDLTPEQKAQIERDFHNDMAEKRNNPTNQPVKPNRTNA